MSSKLLSSFNLAYNPTHQILICVACQYAIQPSAIPSHLLKHKIYRQEKARLLTAISLLHLSDSPTTPSPNSAAIDGLEILLGFKCVVEACRYLCVSEKRMNWHWSEIHTGMANMRGNEGRKWVEVMLQTFFRGRGIRYFEVDGDPMRAEASSLEEERFAELEEKGEEVDIEMADKETVAANTPRQPISLELNVDLDILNYFHHFINTTASTLPCTEIDHWRKTIVPLALKRQSLTCGLLAISAYHLASLAENVHTSRLLYLERARQFSASFTQSEQSDNRQETREIRLILHFAQSSIAPWPAAELDIYDFVSTIQSLSTSSPDTQIQTRTPSQPSKICHTTHMHSLHNLPHRLAEVFPNPSNSQAEDIFAVLEAIRFLGSCLDAFWFDQFGDQELRLHNHQWRDQRERQWQVMINWIHRVPRKFMALIEHGDGAALVVVCHWAVYLLKIDGNHDSYHWWFLKGLAQRLISRVKELMPPHVGQLVDGLMA